MMDDPSRFTKDTQIADLVTDALKARKEMARIEKYKDDHKAAEERYEAAKAKYEGAIAALTLMVLLDLSHIAEALDKIASPPATLDDADLGHLGGHR